MLQVRIEEDVASPGRAVHGGGPAAGDVLAGQTTAVVLHVRAPPHLRMQPLSETCDKDRARAAASVGTPDHPSAEVTIVPADGRPSDALRRLNVVDKLFVAGHINACLEELRAESARVKADSTDVKGPLL